jgi:RNA polymerase sigma factor (sigma-70 family)
MMTFSLFSCLDSGLADVHELMTNAAMPSDPEPSVAPSFGEGAGVTREQDAVLLQAYVRNRDEAAFRELVRRFSGLVWSAVRRRLGGDQVLVEDAVQQTFIALARHPMRAARAVSVGAWLHRTATFEAGNLLRREIRLRHRAEAVRDVAITEMSAESEASPWQAALPYLDEALAGLGETDRAVLVWHHMEGLSYQEIGKRLNCAEGAAQRRGHRALEKLAARLRRHRVVVPLGILAGGLSQAVLPGPAHAAMAGRAFAAGGAAGSGAGWLAVLGSPLALGTVAVLAAGVMVFVATRPVAPTPVAVVVPVSTKIAAPPATKRAIARQPAFQPEKPDNRLTEDELAFINLAKADPIAAMAWARHRFPASGPLFQFLQRAVRALADRDLPAADQLLVHAGVNRSDAFTNILASRLKRDFAGAVHWADDWMASHPDEHWDPGLRYPEFEDESWFPEIRQALAASRTATMRTVLIRMECERLMAEDEAGLEFLAATLEGKERQQVLQYQLSVMLMRGHPQAGEMLRSLKPTTLYLTEYIARRNPVLVLNYHMSLGREDALRGFYTPANDVFNDWHREDPAAAEAWCGQHTWRQFFNTSLYGPQKLVKKGGSK